jgi:hypothetical protein
MEPLVHYCIVRDDLPKGVMAAQLVHAAGESGPAVQGTHAIALQATRQDLEDLALELALEGCGFAFAPIVETDAPFAGELVAIGFAPVARSSALRGRLRRFPLVR